MVKSPSDESTLLLELRALAERGRHRDVLGRLEALSTDMLERRTVYALLAAEAYGRLGAHAEAERWAQAALTIARARGERHAELRARNYQGAIALERGHVDAAEPHFAAALELARSLQDHAAEARCLNNLGIIANLRGDSRAAAATYERLQHPVGLAEVWRLGAGVARARGDSAGAVARLGRAAELARGQGSAHTLAEIERDLSAALEAIGDAAGARAARERAVALYRGLGAAPAAAEIAALIK